jgi:hypothetical protein
VWDILARQVRRGRLPRSARRALRPRLAAGRGRYSASPGARRYFSSRVAQSTGPRPGLPRAVFPGTPRGPASPLPAGPRRRTRPRFTAGLPCASQCPPASAGRACAARTWPRWPSRPPARPAALRIVKPEATGKSRGRPFNHSDQPRTIPLPQLSAPGTSLDAFNRGITTYSTYWHLLRSRRPATRQRGRRVIGQAEQSPRAPECGGKLAFKPAQLDALAHSQRLARQFAALGEASRLSSAARWPAGPRLKLRRQSAAQPALEPPPRRPEPRPGHARACGAFRAVFPPAGAFSRAPRQSQAAVAPHQA